MAKMTWVHSRKHKMSWGSLPEKIFFSYQKSKQTAEITLG